MTTTAIPLVYLLAMCAEYLCVDVAPAYRRAGYVYHQIEIFIPQRQLVAGNEMTAPRICPPPARVIEGECSSAESGRSFYFGATKPSTAKPLFARGNDDRLIGDVRPLTPDEYVMRFAGSQSRARLLYAYPKRSQGERGMGMLVEVY